MKLSELLEKLEYKATVGNTGKTADTANIEISEVANDSRKITTGCLFICVKGANFDGHLFATAAQEKGAAAIEEMMRFLRESFSFNRLQKVVPFLCVISYINYMISQGVSKPVNIITQNTQYFHPFLVNKSVIMK